SLVHGFCKDRGRYLFVFVLADALNTESYFGAAVGVVKVVADLHFKRLVGRQHDKFIRFGIQYEDVCRVAPIEKIADAIDLGTLRKQARRERKYVLQAAHPEL